MATADPQSSPFIKHLASSDKKTRESALYSLRTYLSTLPTLAPLDALKLWKGLYYCLWMQDKPLHQQQLARDLASLVDVLKDGAVVEFLRAFWKTMSAMWNEIGSLRMDKFLLLVRLVLNESFRYLEKRKWSAKKMDGVVEVLGETPLNAMDARIPNGLRYHVLDIYVDELEKVVGEKIDTEVLGTLMGPAEKMAKESKVKSVRTAAKELLDDDRLKAWRGEKVESNGDAEMGDGDEEEEEEWGGIED